MASGDQKRTMHKNSMLNLGKKNKREGSHQFAQAFKDDLYNLWTKKVYGEPGTTKGQKILEEAAMASPMAFAKMASGLLPKEIHEEHTVKMDFAETLRQLSTKVNNRELPEHTEDSEIEDIQWEPVDDDEGGQIGGPSGADKETD